MSASPWSKGFGLDQGLHLHRPVSASFHRALLCSRGSPTISFVAAAPSILIAEDDPLLCDLYKKKFSIAGFRIRTAQDGEQAIAAIEEDTPDLLILDINMPVIDGFGVLERYPKEDRPFEVVLLTNFGDKNNKERGKTLGVQHFLVKKDMTIKSLISFVETLLTQNTSD